MAKTNKKTATKKVAKKAKKLTLAQEVKQTQKRLEKASQKTTPKTEKENKINEYKQKIKDAFNASEKAEDAKLSVYKENAIYILIYFVIIVLAKAVIEVYEAANKLTTLGYAFLVLFILLAFFGVLVSIMNILIAKSDCEIEQEQAHNDIKYYNRKKRDVERIATVIFNTNRGNERQEEYALIKGDKVTYQNGVVVINWTSEDGEKRVDAFTNAFVTEREFK